MRDLELYLHIPFCVHKCFYCDFLSVAAPETVRQQYVQKLISEISFKSGEFLDYNIRTVFFGGGTPSILTESQIQQLMEQLYQSFSIAKDAEITLECNPGTLTEEKLRTYRALGINRLSIGLQSADTAELQLLGRIHTYEQFLENYCLAREMGLDNINVDLISAIPKQTSSTYEQTLKKVIALQPEHISAYSLILEEGTPFYTRYKKAADKREKGLPQSLLPDEDAERDLYALTNTRLSEAGYYRYEISNYCKPGRECAHNVGYWQRKEYLGLGVNAASLVGNVRFSNTGDLKHYLSEAAEKLTDPESVHRLTIQEQMEEFMFLGLRMIQGISAADFVEQFGCSIQSVYGTVLAKQVEQGLLLQTPQGYRLSDYGIDISNYVLAQYLL